MTEPIPQPQTIEDINYTTRRGERKSDRKMVKLKLAISIKIACPVGMSPQEAIMKFTKVNNFSFKSVDEIDLLDSQTSVTFTS